MLWHGPLKDVWNLLSAYSYSEHFTDTTLSVMWCDGCDVMLTGWRWSGEIWSDAEGVVDDQPGVDGILQRTDENTATGMCVDSDRSVWSCTILCWLLYMVTSYRAYVSSLLLWTETKTRTKNVLRNQKSRIKRKIVIFISGVDEKLAIVSFSLWEINNNLNASCVDDL